MKTVLNKIARLPRRAFRRLGEAAGFEVREKVPPFSPFVRKFTFAQAPFEFWIANADAEKWYREGGWREAAEYHELKKMVRPGDRILEIGSHHGFTGLLLGGMTGPAGSVLGLEAQPVNAMVAMAQLTLNPHVQNVRFIHAAGGATEGKLTVSDWHNSRVLEDGGAGEGAEVRMTTGDALNREAGPFDMLKVDVEGFECLVLQGCRDLLSSGPKLAIELHVDLLRRYGSSLEEFLELIDADRCSGTMLPRSGPQTAVPFDPKALPTSGIVNLFLEKKK